MSICSKLNFFFVIPNRSIWQNIQIFKKEIQEIVYLATKIYLIKYDKEIKIKSDKWLKLLADAISLITKKKEKFLYLEIFY